MRRDVGARKEIKSLDAILNAIEAMLDIDGLRRRLRELEDQLADSGLWQRDKDRFLAATRELWSVRTMLTDAQGLRHRLDDAAAALDLGDEDLAAEAAAALPELAQTISALELRTLMCGKYDERDAIVEVSTAASSLDAGDWPARVLWMYLRWAERHGYKTQPVDGWGGFTPRATFEVKAPYAYGKLIGEEGVHRLIRISPYDNESRRGTVSATVEVMPVATPSDDVGVDDEELRVDVYPKPGAYRVPPNVHGVGVCITHLGTGIVGTCIGERSVFHARAMAMAVVRARLLKRRRLHDVSHEVVREYTLPPHGPHRQAKVEDPRTGVETFDASSVLLGDIDLFIDAQIRWRLLRPQAG